MVAASRAAAVVAAAPVAGEVVHQARCIKPGTSRSTTLQVFNFQSLPVIVLVVAAVVGAALSKEVMPVLTVSALAGSSIIGAVRLFQGGLWQDLFTGRQRMRVLEN